MRETGTTATGDVSRISDEGLARLSIRNWILKLLFVFLPSAGITVLVLEVVFRVVIPAAEQPYALFDFENGILKYDRRSKTDGTYTVGRWAQQRGRWRINNHGWNSEIDYDSAAFRTKPLLAIVGDSYVEGFQTDIHDNVASLLRRSLASRYDVYGFGVSGAPLSQYLQMSVYVRDVFEPDVLVFFVVYNDFAGSLVTYENKPYFRQLIHEEDGFAETTPVPYEPSWTRRLLSRSALVRYVMLNLRLQGNVRQFFAGRGDENTDDRQSSTTAEQKTLEEATHHIVRRIRDENPDVEIIFVIDAPRREIYSGERPVDGPNWRYRTLRDAALQNRCHFLDLTDSFRQKFLTDGLEFNTPYDFHWNDVGHETAARSLLRLLEKTGLLVEPGA